MLIETPFVERAEVRRKLKVSTSTLYRAEKDGLLQPIHYKQNRVFYRAEQVAEYAKSRKR
jgi:predicted site-specific integrase-resolvase